MYVCVNVFTKFYCVVVNEFQLCGTYIGSYIWRSVPVVS